MDAVATNRSQTAGKGLNIALWVVQVLVGVAFVMSGLFKVATPFEELLKKMHGMQMAEWLVRFIGASELAGGLGVLLPALTRIKPWLTPLAALGLVVVMVLAVGFHIMTGQASTMAPAVVLGALSAFVAWGRFKKAPIAPR